MPDTSAVTQSSPALLGVNFETLFLGTSLKTWAIVLGIVFGAFVLRRLLSKGLLNVAFRLLPSWIRARADDAVTGSSTRRRRGPLSLQDLLRGPLDALVVTGAAWLAAGLLHLPNVTLFGQSVDLNVLDSKILGLGVIVVLGWLTMRIVDFMAALFRLRQLEHGTTPDGQFIPFFSDFAKVMVVLFFILLALSSVFGVNVATLVGGLGLGGLAVALAAQDTLANLIGSFTIFIDKPFAVGDTIESEGITGTVEKVGFRSTRIRTLDKSYLTIPNKSLITNPLNNITETSARRANFYLTFKHPLDAAALKAFEEGLQSHLAQRSDMAENPTVRLFAFTDLGVQVLVTYLVNTPSYTEYVGVREEVNYAILELSAAQGLRFASTAV